MLEVAQTGQSEHGDRLELARTLPAGPRNQPNCGIMPRSEMFKLHKPDSAAAEQKRACRNDAGDQRIHYCNSATCQMRGGVIVIAGLLCVDAPPETRDHSFCNPGHSVKRFRVSGLSVRRFDARRRSAWRCADRVHIAFSRSEALQLPLVSPAPSRRLFALAPLRLLPRPRRAAPPGYPGQGGTSEERGC